MSKKDALFITSLLTFSCILLLMYPYYYNKINTKTINTNITNIKDITSKFIADYSTMDFRLPICNNTELIIDKRDELTCFTDCIKDELRIPICINDNLLLALYARGKELSEQT